MILRLTINISRYITFDFSSNPRASFRVTRFMEPPHLAVVFRFDHPSSIRPQGYVMIWQPGWLGGKGEGLLLKVHSPCIIPFCLSWFYKTNSVSGLVVESIIDIASASPMGPAFDSRLTHYFFSFFFSFSFFSGLNSFFLSPLLCKSGQFCGSAWCLRHSFAVDVGYYE